MARPVRRTHAGRMRQTLTAGDDIPQTPQITHVPSRDRPGRLARRPAAVVPHLLGFVPAGQPRRDRGRAAPRPHPGHAPLRPARPARARPGRRHRRARGRRPERAAADRGGGGRIRSRDAGDPGRDANCGRRPGRPGSTCRSSSGSRTAATGPTSAATRRAARPPGCRSMPAAADPAGPPPWPRVGAPVLARPGRRWPPASRRSAASPRSRCARPPAGPSSTSPSCWPRSASPPGWARPGT